MRSRLATAGALTAGAVVFASGAASAHWGIYEPPSLGLLLLLVSPYLVLGGAGLALYRTLKRRGYPQQRGRVVGPSRDRSQVSHRALRSEASPTSVGRHADPRL